MKLLGIAWLFDRSQEEAIHILKLSHVPDPILVDLDTFQVNHESGSIKKATMLAIIHCYQL